MKKLLFITGAILIYSFTYAQEIIIVKPNIELKTDKNSPDWYRYYKTPGLQNPLLKIPMDTTLQYEDAIAFEQKAKHLYQTEKGNVYSLPLDNMPCLRPEINSNMPVAKLSPNGYIPNALNKKPNIKGEIKGIKISPPDKYIPLNK